MPKPEPNPKTSESVEPVLDPDVGVEINTDELKNPLPKIISFDTLSRCGDEIWIENNGQIYRLRRTKQGKLILTK